MESKTFGCKFSHHHDCAQSFSHVRLFAAPWSVATCEAPLSLGFSRQEYWSGLSFPSPGALPNPAISPGSPALQVDSLSFLSHQRSLCVCVCVCTYLNLKMTGVKEPDKQFTTRQFSAFKILVYIATFLKHGKPKNSVKKETHTRKHTYSCTT